MRPASQRSGAYLQRWLVALYASKLGAAERDTLIAYATYLERGGEVCVPAQTIAEKCGRSREWVIRHVTAGTRAGLLEPIGKPTGRRPARYRLTLPTTLT